MSGSRHYVEGDETDETSDSEEGSEDEAEVVSTAAQINVRRPRERPSPTVKDASFKLWNFGAAQVPQQADAPSQHQATV